MNWYLTLMTQKYASFSGRARRTEYWMFFLVYFVIALVIGVVEGLLSIGGYLTGIFALVLLYFMVISGQPQANEYGPDPKAA